MTLSPASATGNTGYIQCVHWGTQDINRMDKIHVDNQIDINPEARTINRKQCKENINTILHLNPTLPCPSRMLMVSIVEINFFLSDGNNIG